MIRAISAEEVPTYFANGYKTRNIPSKNGPPIVVLTKHYKPLGRMTLLFIVTAKTIVTIGIWVFRSKETQDQWKAVFTAKISVLPPAKIPSKISSLNPSKTKSNPPSPPSPPAKDLAEENSSTFQEIFDSPPEELFKQIMDLKLMRSLPKTEHFKLSLKAAKMGHQPSMEKIARMYSGGYGTDKNQTEALHWFTAAANAALNPHLVICEKTGNAYWFGQGVPQDKRRAKEWFSKAIQAGEEIYLRDADSQLQEILRTQTDLDNLT